jgi:hypothetical protein
MSLTTEQSGILANIAIDEYVAACHAGSDRQTVEFLSTLYVLVAQRMKDTGDGDAELVMDSNTAKPEQQRELAGPLAMGQPLGGGENAEPSNPKTQGRQHVATVVGADEYGPMLEWSTHWVELIGAKLYTRPQQAAQVAQPLTDMATIAGLESAVFHLSRMFDEQRALLVEVEAVFGVDGHYGPFEDGECPLIDRVRAHLIATNAPATPPQQEQAAPVQDGWMPIETAPKTTKSILVHCSEMRNTYVVAWSHTRDGGEGWVYFCPGNYMLIEEPTHWMPLPAAPKAQEPGA